MSNRISSCQKGSIANRARLGQISFIWNGEEEEEEGAVPMEKLLTTIMENADHPVARKRSILA